MKKLIIALAIMFASVSNANAEKIYGNFYGVHYIRNYDGDTITFNINYVPAIIGREISVRVLGVDTPEIKAKCKKEKKKALAAKYYVNEVLSNAEYINLINMRRGKYFRIVADVVTEKGSLTQLLLDKGYAIEYSGGTKTKDWCE